MSEGYAIGDTCYVADSSSVTEGKIVYRYEPKEGQLKLAVLAGPLRELKVWPETYQTLFATAAEAWGSVARSATKNMREWMERIEAANQYAVEALTSKAQNLSPKN